MAELTSTVRMLLGVGLIMAGGTAFLAPLEAYGQDATNAAAPAWSFSVSPYVWFAGMSGKVAPFSRLPPANLDLKFKDIFDNLDWSPPPIMLATEIRRGRFAFVSDFMYLGIAEDGPTRSALFPAAEANVHNVIATFVGSYRALQDETASVDVYAGGRLWSTQTKFSLIAAPGNPIGNLSAENTETWVDPIIGLNLHVNLGDGFAIRWAGDVGGFGAASDITWQLLGTVQYQANDWLTLEAGYRHLAVDYEKNGFVFDTAISGPIMGGTLHF
jgi:hypothetical protein